jgi:hypothetical protein
VFIIDNSLEGAALYCLSSGVRVCAYLVSTSKSMRACQVSFAESCTHIVIGSDHGKVYVFDWWSGEVVDMLDLGSDIWVQVTTISGYNLPSWVF